MLFLFPDHMYHRSSMNARAATIAKNHFAPHNRRMKHVMFVVMGAASLLIASPVYANDGAAAIGLGGLEIKQNEAISMDSEELFLSMKRVTVKYQFTNTTDKDVKTLVSFPLPILPYEGEEGFGDQAHTIWEELDFQTKVDGLPLKLDYRQTATIDGEDITSRLKQLGWPIQYWLDDDFQRKLKKLSKAELAKYLSEGLLKQSARGVDIYADWKVATHVTREQVFPANKTITVEHSYRPITGGTNGGNMSAYARNNPDYGFKWFQKTYCIDDNFTAGFDKTYNARDKEKRQQYVELFLDYRLSPGANWKGPIKKFRLVVDKSETTNLVSFCMDGVKKISPTRFEVTKTNFEPEKDLKILIVRWFDFP